MYHSEFQLAPTRSTSPFGMFLWKKNTCIRKNWCMHIMNLALPGYISVSEVSEQSFLEAPTSPIENVSKRHFSQAYEYHPPLV